MPHAEAPGARICYETRCSGEPLLMISGFGANAVLNAEVAAFLSAPAKELVS